MITRFITFSILLLGLMASCNHNDATSQDKDSFVDSSTFPDSEVSGARITLSNRGRVTTEIIAEDITKYDEKDSTMAYNLDIDSYDSLGQVDSHVTGDSAIIRGDAGLFIIYGHVNVVTEDSIHLETDILYWNPKTDSIHTDSDVKITTPHEIHRGRGLVANRRISRFRILDRSSGVISNPERFTEPATTSNDQ